MSALWRAVRFVALFALVFLGGTRLHQLTLRRTAPFLVGTLTVRPSSALINLLTPSERTRAVGNLIEGGTTIQVAQGCDGIDSLLLLFAALVAFPLDWRRKLLGLSIGLPLLYACNQVRITSLYYVQRHSPRYFDFAHEWVGQTFIILIGCCFFVSWCGILSQADE